MSSQWALIKFHASAWPATLLATKRTVPMASVGWILFSFSEYSRYLQDNSQLSEGTRPPVYCESLSDFSVDSGPGSQLTCWAARSWWCRRGRCRDDRYPMCRWSSGTCPRQTPTPSLRQQPRRDSILKASGWSGCWTTRWSTSTAEDCSNWWFDLDNYIYWFKLTCIM